MSRRFRTIAVMLALLPCAVGAADRARWTFDPQLLLARSEAVIERARNTARETNEYVHEHPWNAVGIAFL